MTLWVQDYWPGGEPMPPGTTPPCWILLRGLVRESRHWGSFGQRLADTLQVRVLSPDLPGNGQLHRMPSPLQLSALVDHLRSEMLPRHTSNPELSQPPFRLLGLSMGAMVATAWALDFPAEVDRLVLVNGSLANLSPPWQRLRPGALATLARALVSDTAGKEALIYRLSCHQQRDHILSQWCDYARECPVTGRNTLRQLAAAALYRSNNRVPRAPALLLCSRNDALVDPACSAAIANHWRSPLGIHPDAGHDLPHDAPDWLLAQISNWLAGH
ncbi:alpha/beta fold hydrolase [Marinobacterium rhizophilum]|uniref:Alpha/beta hydrolase n=1 Tax=Marinobacterium rhizophilum TaxID=420402 RepID=A0ABY5HP32_9GAMM|nr:alpha/beta hydrolase [Marinobacterium rhizophilum]UTW12992.1 alpha/beta hydrolase [Marinobacterium rhizophilum]